MQALLTGEVERAVGHLREAVAIQDAAGIAMVAAGVRRRLGQIVAGEEGAGRIAQGDAFMAS